MNHIKFVVIAMGIFTCNGTFCSSSLSNAFRQDDFPGADLAESFSGSDISYVYRVDKFNVRAVIAGAHRNGSLTRGGSLPSLSTEQIDMLEESPRNDKVIREWIDSVTLR